MAILANWANHMSLPEKIYSKEYAIVQWIQGKDVERFHRLSFVLDTLYNVRGNFLVLPINGGGRDVNRRRKERIKMNLSNYRTSTTHKVLLEKSQSVLSGKRLFLA